MEKRTLETEMQKSEIKLFEYMQEFCQGKKPLGESALKNFRKYFHKLYAPYGSWLAKQGLEWQENQTPLDEVEKQINESVEIFGPKTFDATAHYIDKVKEFLIKKGKLNSADRVADTAAVAAKQVLETDLKSAIDFSTQNIKKNAKTMIQ